MSIPNIKFKITCFLLTLYSQFATAQTCTITPAPLNFGQISSAATSATTATTTLGINCSGFSGLGKIRVCFNFGTGSGGTSYSPRAAVNGSTPINYNVYADASFTTILGKRGAAYGPQSGDLTPNASGSVSATVTIYGQVPGNQTGLIAGTYTSSFAGTQSEFDYAPYVLTAPSCTTLTSNATPIPLSITATIVKNCTLSATSINFGTTGLLSTGMSANGSLTATCTLNIPYSIALSAGTVGPINDRGMQISSTANIVRYGLYQDSNYSTPWGDGTSGTSAYSGTGTGNAQLITVYGYVPVQTSSAPGSYSDTVTATITY